MCTDGRVEQVDAYFLGYAMDTSGGQRGSPVFQLDHQQLPTAAGAHACGSPGGNHAVRITTDTAQLMTRWFR